MWDWMELGLNSIDDILSSNKSTTDPSKYFYFTNELRTRPGRSTATVPTKVPMVFI